LSRRKTREAVCCGKQIKFLCTDKDLHLLEKYAGLVILLC